MEPTDQEFLEVLKGIEMSLRSIAKDLEAMNEWGITVNRGEVER